MLFIKYVWCHSTVTVFTGSNGKEGSDKGFASAEQY